MRLFHFSEDPAIATFVPRPVRVPVSRGADREWLNGALVWAIDEVHQPMYLFPRECPRILLWPTARTTEADKSAWWQGSGAKVLAYIEQRWLERFERGKIYRYALPDLSFLSLHDAGMWVSQETVRPLACETLDDLRLEHARRGVELRVLNDLLPLKGVWDTSLHASGIRLRNARGWGEPGWPHSKA